MAVVGTAFIFTVGPEKGYLQRQKQTQVGPTPIVARVNNFTYKNDQKDPAQRAPASHAGGELLNCLTLVVAALTGLAVWKQAKESAKATNAMQDSITLQEKAMEQWVELSNWKAETLAIPPSRYILLIKVDLTNNTSFPLTVDRGEMMVTNLISGTPIRVDYAIGDGTFLPPKNPYQIEFSIGISAEQYENFGTHSFSLGLVGFFTHTGVLKKRKLTQNFGGALECGENWTRFYPQINMNPVPISDVKDSI